MSKYLQNKNIFFDVENLEEIFFRPPENFIESLKKIENIDRGNHQIFFPCQSLIYEHLKLAKNTFDRYILLVYYGELTHLEVSTGEFDSPDEVLSYCRLSQVNLFQILKFFKPELELLSNDKKFSELRKSVNVAKRMADFWIHRGAPMIYDGEHILSIVHSKNESLYKHWTPDIEIEFAMDYTIRAIEMCKFETFKYFFEKVKNKKELFDKIEKKIGWFDFNPEIFTFLKNEGLSVSEEANNELGKQGKNFFTVRRVPLKPEVLDCVDGRELEAIEILLKRLK